jgi:hypothetical protein
MTPELSRLAKMLIDAEGITYTEAETRLRAMTLEVVVGDGAHNVAGHNAILTAVAVGKKTFVGGVAVRIDQDVPLISALPVERGSLREAVDQLGASEFENDASIRIVVGNSVGCPPEIYTWWDGWKGGASSEPRASGISDNPLAGIVAGAAAVAQAFARLRKIHCHDVSEFDLWPQRAASEPPPFAKAYLPGALWLLGLGNLGQAFMWSISALPYPDPQAIKLILQDVDRVGAENWGTSVLVQSGEYGAYKTALAEHWAKRKGFDVRRVDRLVDPYQRLQECDPTVALCGFDSVTSRRFIDGCGFEIVIDAGLGRAHTDFDVFRVTVFDSAYSVATHFPTEDAPRVRAPQDYEALLGLDGCGAAEFEGIGIAAPFVSSIAAATAVARAIAICSGVSVPRNEKRRLSDGRSKLAAPIAVSGRGIMRISS